jgi:signal transduction histidine kinase
MSSRRGSIPWFVNADRTRVKQVLINLLSNAIKYNRPGGAVK